MAATAPPRLGGPVPGGIEKPGYSTARGSDDGPRAPEPAEAVGDGRRRGRHRPGPRGGRGAAAAGGCGRERAGPGGGGGAGRGGAAGGGRGGAALPVPLPVVPRQPGAAADERRRVAG